MEYIYTDENKIIMPHELVAKYGIDSKSNVVVTGSLIATNCISTASWATNAVTSSVMENVEYARMLLLMGG